MTTRGSDRPLVTDPLRLAGGGVLVAVAATALAFTTAPLALALAALGLLTLWRPAWGVAVLFVVASLRALDSPGWGFVGGSVIRFWELALGAAVSGLVLRTGREADLRPLAAGAPFIVGLALSGLWSTELYKVPPHVLRGAAPVIAVFLAWNVRPEPGSGRALRSALAAGAVLYGGFAVVEFLDAPGRVSSLFYTANVLGAYTALLVPFVAARIGGVRGLPSAGWISALVLLLVVEVLSVSRGSALAFVSGLAAVAAVAFLRPHRAECASDGGPVVRPRRRIAIGALSAVAAFVLICGLLLLPVAMAPGDLPATPATPDQVDRLTPLASVSQFRALRLPYWRMGWEIWRDHLWLGIGPGRYGPVVAEYEDRLPELGYETADYPREAVKRSYRRHVHMGYLQLAIGSGAVGLAGYLFFVGWLVRALWVRSGASWWALGGLGALTGLVLHNVIDVTWVTLAVEWGLLLGFAAAPPPARHGPRWPGRPMEPGR